VSAGGKNKPNESVDQDWEIAAQFTLGAKAYADGRSGGPDSLRGCASFSRPSETGGAFGVIGKIARAV